MLGENLPKFCCRKRPSNCVALARRFQGALKQLCHSRAAFPECLSNCVAFEREVTCFRIVTLSATLRKGTALLVALRDDLAATISAQATALLSCNATSICLQPHSLPPV